LSGGGGQPTTGEKEPRPGVIVARGFSREGREIAAILFSLFLLKLQLVHSKCSQCVDFPLGNIEKEITAPN